MRKIVGGFVFKDLPDWITYSQFFCLRDLKYINISITEEVCPFCIQELQIKTNNIYCNQKEFLDKYCDRETKEKYKQIQDVTFEIGIKILNKIEEYDNDYRIKDAGYNSETDLVKKIEQDDSKNLLNETIAIIFETLLIFYLKSKNYPIPHYGIKDYFGYEEYEKYLNFFENDKYKEYKRIQERLLTFFKENEKDFYLFINNNFNPKITENAEIGINTVFCKVILEHYMGQFLLRGRQRHIRKIEVRNLFGYHSYDLELKNDLAIIIGSNALGKTTIFNILECLLVEGSKKEQIKKWGLLFSIPFKSFKVEFNNGGYISLIKKGNDVVEIKSKRDCGFTGDVPHEIEIIKDNLNSLTQYYERIKEVFPEIAYKIKRFLFVKTKRLNISSIKSGFKKLLTNKQNNDFDRFLIKEKTNKYFIMFSSLYYENDPSQKLLEIDDENNLVVRTSNNEILNIKDLSSGEQNILAIISKILCEAEAGAIVLIDEPEISLHIAWQSKLYELIKEIMRINEGVQVIMATHSPFIAAGNTDLLVEAELVEQE